MESIDNTGQMDCDSIPMHGINLVRTSSASATHSTGRNGALGAQRSISVTHQVLDIPYEKGSVLTITDSDKHCERLARTCETR
ncbi:hypothetical protein Ciccas_005936 [Cichlidogyrus casuarinus]|uniref:Uncharacterized protein n=1 Tax=Cichlidogyrus casuarinus TaxID=1844966 RepID=A0ABD2Q8D2_9PLAT